MDWRRSLVIAVLLAARLPGVHAAEAEEPGRPQMTLVVCNKAGADLAMLEAARDTNIRIFSRAGIDMTWLSTCAMPAKPTYFVVVIAHRAPKSWTSPDAMGFAPIRTGAMRRAYIFQDRLNEMLNRFVPSGFRVSGAGVVLGHAIAHEIAHLLTGGDNHTEVGIMNGRWGYSQWREAVMGRLTFNSDQVQLMREQLLLLSHDP